jgi:hypothetical protein
MNRMTHFVSVALLVVTAGCACDPAAIRNSAHAGKWIIVPLQADSQSKYPGGAILLNSETGETWGMLSGGGWGPMPHPQP